MCTGKANKTSFVAIILAVIVICGLVASLLGLSLGNTPSTVYAAEGNYYASIDTDLRGDALRAQIASLITSTHHTNPSYSAGLAALFEVSDINPNTGKVIQFYTGTETNGFTGNREHVWPKNGGKAFPAESEAGSDGHHLRPCDNNLNSARSSLSFGEVDQTSGNLVKENGSSSYKSLCYKTSEYFYPGEGFRGQTARILMYVQTRWGDDYDLSFVLGAGSNKTIGDIETLMKWHIQEPPTEQEMYRNEKVAEYQGNRNPFIDHPEYAEMIYCHDGESYNDELQAVVETYGSYLADPTPLESLYYVDSSILSNELCFTSSSIVTGPGATEKEYKVSFNRDYFRANYRDYEVDYTPGVDTVRFISVTDAELTQVRTIVRSGLALENGTYLNNVTLELALQWVVLYERNKADLSSFNLQLSSVTNIAELETVFKNHYNKAFPQNITSEYIINAVADTAINGDYDNDGVNENYCAHNIIAYLPDYSGAGFVEKVSSNYVRVAYEKLSGNVISNVVTSIVSIDDLIYG